MFRKGYGKKNKPKTIALHSGDALIFGGKSRGILHAVPKVYSSSVSVSAGGGGGGPKGGEREDVGGGGGGGLRCTWADLTEGAPKAHVAKAMAGLGTSAASAARLNLNFREF